jgi:ABC-type iron transport system FetAB ATPase subunit
MPKHGHFAETEVGARLPTGPGVLSVRGLRRPGLEAADLDVASGECVVLAGASGSGKSLLLRAIADLDPNAGTVSLDGAKRDAMPAPAWRRRVAYVPTESGWWSATVGDHFADVDAAAALLPRLGLAAGALDWPVARLSTGERQRLALGRALSLEPRALLLDEPTSGLDPEATQAVEAELARRLTGGAAALLVTHDAAQAAQLGRRHLVMRDGRLNAGGGTGEAP